MKTFIQLSSGHFQMAITSLINTWDITKNAYDYKCIAASKLYSYIFIQKQINSFKNI